MAYVKIPLYCVDAALTFQDWAQLADNIEQHRDDLSVEHGTSGIDPDANGHPWAGVGIHNSEYIPRSTVRVVAPVPFSYINIDSRQTTTAVRGMMLLGGERGVTAVSRVSRGVYDFAVQYLPSFRVTCPVPENDAFTDPDEGQPAVRFCKANVFIYDYDPDAPLVIVPARTLRVTCLEQVLSGSELDDLGETVGSFAPNDFSFSFTVYGEAEED